MSGEREREREEKRKEGEMESAAPLVLAQFRPAWGEQAYLRLCGVRHHVENARFPFSASAGELPQLKVSAFMHACMPCMMMSFVLFRC